MTKELAVAVIHGMGSQEPDFAKEMIREVNGRLGDTAEEVAWRSIFWADILHPAQERYFESARQQADVDYQDLRQFVISAFGDAVAYQEVGGRNSSYEKIHRRVGETMKALFEEDLGGQARPLIVMAHSLGGHIMSNFIWDRQKGRDEAGLSDFEKMKTLSGLITFGCNIPLFTFAHENVVPIAFPEPSLPNDLKSRARWLNFYDPDDALGYPLKPINEAYSRAVSEDLPINVGGLLSNWNPMSHAAYWTDNDFTKPVARFLDTFLRRDISV